MVRRKPTRKRRIPSQETTVETRQRRALELRISGLSYDAIAAALGYANRGGAWKAVDAALPMSESTTKDIRTVEVARLDAMLVAIHGKVKRGSLGAVDRALKIQERRARLLGLDQSFRVDVGGNILHTLADIRKAMPDADT